MSTTKTLYQQAAPSDVPVAGGPVVVAPYALVRLSTLPYWSETEHMTAFRRALEALTACQRRLDALAPVLEHDLYQARSGHSERFHRQVVLPLRRDVHNERVVPTVRREQASTLGDRIPALTAWLAAIDERERLRGELADLLGAALADERAALAAVCGAEPLRRAAALSGQDLLHGLHRAADAGSAPGARARKAEPTILRYALRATTKTSPWSWFTAVGWGTWTQEDLPSPPPAFHSVTSPNHGLIAWMLKSLLARPQVRWQVPHRLASASTVDDGQVTFRRERLTTSTQYIGIIEQQVRLRRTRTLDVVLSRARARGRAGVLLGPLLAELLERMPATEATGRDAVTAYLDRLADEQLLVPMAPIDPQEVDPLPALAAWAERVGSPDVASVLRALGSASAGYAAVPADDRPAARERLDLLWDRVIEPGSAGTPDSPALLRPASAVREDVVLRGRLDLGPAYGSRLRSDLARLAPLTELFDVAAALRAALRGRLLDAGGWGGRCRVADLVTDAAALWSAAARTRMDGTLSPDDGAGAALPAELVELGALRRQITAAVRSGTIDDDEVEVTDGLIAEAAAATPAWFRRYPVSHSYFVHPFRLRNDVHWCLNQVCDGWGRYTSRFLHWLDGDLAGSVAGMVRTTLGERRTAQYRPVSGSNVNLHPLLFDDVGEDPAWAGLSPDDLDLVHDPVTDTVNLRVRRTGEAINVLYLGLLLAPLLPDRVIPLYLDLGCNRAAFRHLAPVETVRFGDRQVERQPRVRYRRLVLARRCWTLDPATVAELVTELRHDGDVPVAAVARWSAGLGLPGAAFLSGGDRAPISVDPAVMNQYLQAPKPQYVDLGSALHLRCLRSWLTRHRGAVCLEEALPVPGSGPADGRVVELVAETYRGRGSA